LIFGASTVAGAYAPAVERQSLPERGREKYWDEPRNDLDLRRIASLESIFAFGVSAGACRPNS